MRIVGSMTTVPNRVRFIQPVLEAILQQPIDLLYVNIPRKSSKGFQYSLPADLKKFISQNPRIHLVRGKDYGPITKLIPALQHESDGETVIITFDDDIIPRKGMVQNFISHLPEYPEAALGYSGVCLGQFPFYFQTTNSLQTDQRVDWIEGVYGGCYRRKFFSLPDLLQFPKESLSSELFFNDDHWISGYLASRNIDRISLGYHYQDYFEETSLQQIDPLSGKKINLFCEHARILKSFHSKGWYGQSYSPWHSVGFYILLVIVILVFLCLCVRF